MNQKIPPQEFQEVATVTSDLPQPKPLTLPSECFLLPVDANCEEFTSLILKLASISHNNAVASLAHGRRRKGGRRGRKFSFAL